MHHHERRQLVQLIVHHYGSYAELEVFLDGIGHPLSVISPPDPMEQVVNRVVDRAYRRGWLALLAREIATELAHVAELQRLADLADAGLPPDLSAADIALYDMDDIETKFREARMNADGNLVGAAISCYNETFRDYLYRRLGRLTGAEPRPATSLDPNVSSLATTLTMVTQLSRPLRWRPQLVPVRAEGLPDAHALVTEFWTRLSASMGPLDHELVVVFTVPPGIALPATVTRLPDPSIQDGHVAEWVDLVADALRWPPGSPRRKRLARQICSRVQGVEETLRLHTLYRELEDQLHDLQFDLDSVVAALDAA